MNDLGPIDPETAIEDEALGWFVRMRGEVDTALKTQFDEWYARSSEHQRAYHWAEGHFGASEVLKKSSKLDTKWRYRPRHWLMAGAAAAAMILVLVGFEVNRNASFDRTSVASNDSKKPLVTAAREIRTWRLAATSSNFNSKAGGNPHVTGVLFAGQLRSVTTVARFREIMERLDREEAATRERVLSSFRPGRGDPSVLVNHGWMKESRGDGFDWEAAQRDYGASYEIAMRWGNLMLASRCAVARAMCLDENGDDAEGAFAWLSEAEARIGPDVALGRARAKIHWRRRDHAAALPLLAAAAEAGGQDRIERAYIAREAGISAAALGDWGAAYQWFERAQEAAEAAAAIPSVRAMAIGLLADTAQAAIKAGRPDVAIGRMRDALVALPLIDAEGTLVEAHCHRVVRHGVLWLYREITGALADDLDETVYAPGAASNPEPLEAIRSHPVPALDMTFYMLANADEALAEPTGFHLNFRKYLVIGPVLASEISAAIADDRKVIGTHDPSGFVDRVRRHASMSRMVDAGEARESAEQLTSPRRGTIPLAEIVEGAPAYLVRAAEDYLLSFATAAVMARELVSAQRHDLLPIGTAPAIILVAEGNAGLVEAHESAVRDRDAVRVAR